VVAVAVVGGDPAELVAGCLGGLVVVGGGLLVGRVAGQGAELEQCPGVAGQYRFPLEMTAPA
jgi:hypothetical protein